MTKGRGKGASINSAVAVAPEPKHASVGVKAAVAAVAVAKAGGKGSGKGAGKVAAVAAPEAEQGDGELSVASTELEEPCDAEEHVVRKGRALSWEAAAERVVAKKVRLAEEYRKEMVEADADGQATTRPTAVAVIAQVNSEDSASLRWTDVEDPCGIIVAECRKQRDWLDAYTRALKAGRQTPARWLEMLRKHDVSRTLVLNCTKQLRSQYPRYAEGSRASGSGQGSDQDRGGGGKASRPEAGEAKKHPLALWQPAE